MTDKAILIRRRLRDDFLFYAERVLKIRTKRGDIVPLRLNRAQEHIHEQLEAQKKETGKVRAIILKGRQQGCSTYVGGRYYWLTTHRKGCRTFILTHEQDATDNLFEMTGRYHEHCPPQLRPQTGASSSKELHFDLLDSGYKVGTAGSKGVGRSNTIQQFHGSEVAFWPHAEEHWAGIMQAVPDEPGTEVILESTANGVGGLYHDTWTAAERGESDYLPIFVPWHWQPEYRRDEKITLTADEELLAKSYGLDKQQIAWRRAKIRELMSEDRFKQEYPFTPDEAFLFSGRMVFYQNHVLAATAETFSPEYRAAISPAGAVTKRGDGELRVWEDPMPSERYVIGADVAEGLEHGDYSCADVLAVSDGRQVAQWHGHVDPDRYGQILYHLGRRYKKALIGVERNNHGLTTLTTLKHKGYPNLYAQRDIERRSDGVETKKVGWLTTSKSKVKIIDQLAAELRDGDHGICCKETVEELGTYVIHDNGSYGAKQGKYDDRVMSRAIAGEMLYAVPRGRRK